MIICVHSFVCPQMWIEGAVCLCVPVLSQTWRDDAVAAMGTVLGDGGGHGGKTCDGALGGLRSPHCHRCWVMLRPCLVCPSVPGLSGPLPLPSKAPPLTRMGHSRGLGAGWAQRDASRRIPIRTAESSRHRNPQLPGSGPAGPSELSVGRRWSAIPGQAAQPTPEADCVWQWTPTFSAAFHASISFMGSSLAGSSTGTFSWGTMGMVGANRGPPPSTAPSPSPVGPHPPTS